MNFLIPNQSIFFIATIYKYIDAYDPEAKRHDFLRIFQ